MTERIKVEDVDVTLIEVVEALGCGDYGIAHEAHAMGKLSTDELKLFGGALTGRLKRFYGEPMAPFRAAEDLLMGEADRQQRIHTVGSTVADIMLSQDATSDKRSTAV